MYTEPTRSSRTRDVPDGVRHYVLGETQVAANATPAITDVLDRLVLLSSTSGAKAITTISAHEGQRLSIFLLAATGGSYTLPVASGTLTLDAANEHALVERVNGTWRVLSLSGATIV